MAEADDGWGEALAAAGVETPQSNTRPAPPPIPPPADTSAGDADWAAALNEQAASDTDIGMDPALAFTAADRGPEIPTDNAPSLVPQPPADAAEESPEPAEDALQEDIETVAARRVQRGDGRHRLKLRLALPALILALLGINAALVIWRTNVVRAVPQTASLYAAIGLPVNLRGLEFTNVTVTRDQHEGVAVLIVEGLILSVAKTPVEVPRLRLAVRDENGVEIYTWTALPTRSILGAGEQLPFRTRLASPPAEGREVIVRFFGRHDLTTLTR